MKSFAMQNEPKDLKEHCNVIGFDRGHLTQSLFTFLNIYLCTWEYNSSLGGLCISFLCFGDCALH